MHRKFEVSGRSRFGAMALRVAGSLALAFVAYATLAAAQGAAAHEMAHVAKRHITRALLGAIGVGGVVQLLLGDASGIIAVLMSQSEFLLRQSFSRGNEQEADDVGMKYLLASNVDPRGMVRFFERILGENKGQEKLEKYVQWISTHPSTQERIARLNQAITEQAKDKKFPKVGFAFAAFQQKLKREEQVRGSSNQRR